MPIPAENSAFLASAESRPLSRAVSCDSRPLIISSSHAYSKAIRRAALFPTAQFMFIPNGFQGQCKQGGSPGVWNSPYKRPPPPLSGWGYPRAQVYIQVCVNPTEYLPGILSRPRLR